MSSGGHLARENLLIYYSSANTCLNQVKPCTLKVQDGVQLAMAKFCFSNKNCQSQASSNDSTINGLGLKM